ncbi:UPF0149 family protein [Thioalkalivibrio paradoxus]|uniref:UPF0149 family protein n=1 Tax=Thioalkalivibrio paradoxus TaxID=108010 RepID=UPI00022C44D2|nr:UPF0149 family protein [Thioalkalivibrio paradoxus]
MPSLVSHLRTLAAHAVEPLQTETAMHGFLTACALTPEEEVPLADCVEAGFDIPSPEKLPEDARQALEGALDEIRATLHAGNFRFDPPLPVPEGERWCQGYVAGIRAHEDAWSDWHEENFDAAKAALVIQALAIPDLREFFIPPEGVSEDPLTLEGMVALVPSAVRKIAIFRFSTPEIWDYLVDEDAFHELWSDADLAGMSDDELIAKLTELEDRVPRILIDECIRRADTLLPRLHALLADDTMWRPQPDESPAPWWALLHALFILGAIRGEAAGRAFAAALERLRTHPEDSLWEWISTEFPQLCAGKEDFIRPVLLDIARDRALEPLSRVLAMEWLADSYVDDAGEGLDELLDWVASLTTDASEDRMVAEIAGMVLVDHPRERFQALLMSLATSFEAEDPSFGAPYSVADVEQAFSDSPQRPFQPPHFLSFYNPIEIRERQLRWQGERGGFGDDDFGDDVLGIGQDALGWENETLPLPFDTPYVREHPKVGRNDPCPCGSGRKYKKCCMGKT